MILVIYISSKSVKINYLNNQKRKNREKRAKSFKKLDIKRNYRYKINIFTNLLSIYSNN